MTERFALMLDPGMSFQATLARACAKPDLSLQSVPF
jgi:hypothetical protein